MVKNNANNKKTDKLRRQAQSDLAVNRMMLVFVLAVIGVTVMLTAKKSVQNEVFFITTLSPILLVVSAIALIGSLVLFVMRRSKKIDDSKSIVNSANLLGASVAFLASILLYRVNFDAMVSIIAIIAATVLYFVKCIFGNDFFLFTMISGLGLVAFRIGTDDGRLAQIALYGAAAVGLISIILAIIVLVGKGSIKLGKNEITVGKAGIPLFFLGFLIIAGAGISLFVAQTMVTYVIAVLLIAYLAALIVYAIRMM